MFFKAKTNLMTSVFVVKSRTSFFRKQKKPKQKKTASLQGKGKTISFISRFYLTGM